MSPSLELKVTRTCEPMGSVTAVSKPGDVGAQLAKLKDGQLVLLRIRRGDSASFVAVPFGGRQ